MTRKLIFNLAMSLDGYILDKDGKYDWVKGDGDKSRDTKKQFDFPEFIKSVDIILMGRKSFEDCTPEAMEMFKDNKIYVATHRKLKTKYNNVKVINGDIVKEISELKEKSEKDIWLFGGTMLADQFIKADAIDEYIIGIVPIILGDGKKLFLGNNPKLELHLDEHTSQEGVVIMRYTKR